MVVLFLYDELGVNNVCERGVIDTGFAVSVLGSLIFPSMFLQSRTKGAMFQDRNRTEGIRVSTRARANLCTGTGRLRTIL